ncbi:MAG: 1,4-alpha-glucan branching enzyme, partial [Candidatus Saccharimonadales bacterium]
MATPFTATLQRPSSVAQASLLTSDDLYWFNEGTHARLYEKMGAHPGEVEGTAGTFFAVWAPNARQVFADAYGQGSYTLRSRGTSGIWESFVPGLTAGTLYKYRIVSNVGGHQGEKADPFAFHGEIPPKTASMIHPLDYEWRDHDWMSSRRGRNALDAPLSIYEMHLGSWRRRPDGAWMTYRELAQPLIEHLQRAGFTHVEFLPLMEHPFYGSWGYQTT